VIDGISVRMLTSPLSRVLGGSQPNAEVERGNAESHKLRPFWKNCSGNNFQKGDRRAGPNSWKVNGRLDVWLLPPAPAVL